MEKESDRYPLFFFASHLAPRMMPFSSEGMSANKEKQRREREREREAQGVLFSFYFVSDSYVFSFLDI